MLAGHILVEGILAALVRRGITGDGAHVETSLLEAMVDLQFEVLTTHLNDGGRAPLRAATANAHAYLAAPYGVYRTSDGWLALAMTPSSKLEHLLELRLGQRNPFAERDLVKAMVAERLGTKRTGEWIAILQPNDVWCAAVRDWPTLLAEAGFRRLELLQTLQRNGTSITTTRAPLRIDSKRPVSRTAAPIVGAHTAVIADEFGLNSL